MSTIEKIQEEVIQNAELHQFVLESFGLQSKKKRVRKKLLKQVINQEKLLLKTVQAFEQEERAINEEKGTNTFQSVPVTTLLKIGKAFFKEENIIRYYYNKNKPAFYKNKEKLIECISQSYNHSSPLVQSEIKEML